MLILQHHESKSTLTESWTRLGVATRPIKAQVLHMLTRWPGKLRPVRHMAAEAAVADPALVILVKQP